MFSVSVTNMPMTLHCTSTPKVNQLEEAVTDMNVNIERLGHFSDNSNLAVNKSKTKWMLVSTPQMDRVDSLDKKPLSLVYNGSSLERLRVAKLLGVHLDNHLERTYYKSFVLLLQYPSSSKEST